MWTDRGFLLDREFENDDQFGEHGARLLDRSLGGQGDVGDYVFHASVVGKRWKYVLTIPALILAVVMILLLIPDVGLRSETYSSQRKRHAPIPNSLDTQTQAEH